MKKKNLLIFIICLFFYIRLIINFYFNKTKILGQDKMFVLSDEDEWKNYPIVYFKYEDDIDKKDIYQKIKKSLKADPKHMFKNKLNKNRILKIDENYDSLIKNTIILTDKKLDEFSEKEIINLAMKNDNKMIIIFNNTGYLTCFSHLFLDGIRFHKINKYVADFYEEVKLPKFYYIPIYNELITLRSLYNYINNPFYRNLKFEDLSKDIHFTFCLNKFKEKKNRFNTNFTVFLSIIIAYLIFESSKVKKLTCGMIVAFSNTTRFNNYSILPICLYIDEEYKKLDYNNKLKYLLKQSEIQIKKNKYYISSIYTITNIYNMKLLNNYNKLDYLISGFPLNKKFDYSINNSKCESIKTIFRTTTMPLYLFHLSTKEKINLSFNFKTNDIDIIKFEEEINKILQE